MFQSFKFPVIYLFCKRQQTNFISRSAMYEYSVVKEKKTRERISNPETPNYQGKKYNGLFAKYSNFYDRDQQNGHNVKYNNNRA